LNIVCGCNSHTPQIVMITLSKYGNDHHCLIWKCPNMVTTIYGTSNMITLTKYGNLPNMETITNMINMTKYGNDQRNRCDHHYQIWYMPKYGNCLIRKLTFGQLPNMVIPNKEIYIYGNFLIWKL